MLNIPMRIIMMIPKGMITPFKTVPFVPGTGVIVCKDPEEVTAKVAVMVFCIGVWSM